MKAGAFRNHDKKRCPGNDFTARLGLRLNQLTDFLRSLRAVREFQRKAVPDDVVQDILEVARWSGSASNRQFGEIIVVRERETLHALADLGGYVGHLRDAALAMLLVMPGEWPEGETFDEGRLAERIMLGAWAHGWGPRSDGSRPKDGKKRSASLACRRSR
jgi:nitroreductase